MTDQHPAKLAAGTFGTVYVLVGILGFVPFLGGSYGLDSHNLLGLFAVNVVHNVHLAVGGAGLAAFSAGVAASIMFARTVGVVYALLAVLGLVFGAGNFLGLVPIGGLDIGLHAVTALVLLYVGFGMKDRSAVAAR